MPHLSDKLRRMGFPLTLLALTTVYLAAAFHIRVPFDEGVAGPRFMPIVASIIMYAALLRILWRENQDKTGADTLNGLAAPALIVLATAVYVVLFQPLGYPLATFLFTICLFQVFRFETGRPVRMAAYAAAVTLVFYLLFAVAFGIRLPLVPGGL